MSKNKGFIALDLSASQSERSGASQKLGGITLWSKSTDSLERSINYLRDAIQVATSEHLCIGKNVLRKLVRTRIAPRQMEDKVFSAVLGSAMRLGAIDSFVCASKNDRTYRVLVHSSKLKALEEALAMAASEVARRGSVSVPELESKLFGARKYNTWSASAHVLAHLAYKGSVVINDAGDSVLVDRLN